MHRVDRRMDVKQSTHVESIQVGVHVCVLRNAERTLLTDQLSFSPMA